MTMHILIVDDDQRLRRLLRQYLADQGYAVTEAQSAAEARKLLTLFCFDLMILDVMMPGETGLELANNLPQRGETPPPILMLTAMDGSDDRIRGLEAGVEDYLTKPFEPRELLLRIQNILRRLQAARPQPEISFGAFRYDRSRQHLSCNAAPVGLTGVEAVLLDALTEQPGQPQSREALAQKLGNPENLRNVDVQIGRLRKKIEADTTQPRYIQTVRGSGYKLVV